LEVDRINSFSYGKQSLAALSFYYGALFLTQDMKLFRWIPGRQQGVIYYKWCFLYLRIGRVGFDGYILKYPAKTVLSPHTDPIDGWMWRMNVKLRGKARFFCKGRTYSLGDFMHIFRPDLYVHSLVAYTKTIKLSLGIAKFNRFVYCQRDIEGKSKCLSQCEHCKGYYKLLDK